MPLSALKIKNAKPADKNYNLSDGRGLYLVVKPNGSKLWRYNYRYFGKQKTMAYGGWPEVSLADAREMHEEARRLVARKEDPMAVKRADTERKRETVANSFEAVATEWFIVKMSDKSEKHRKRTKSILDKDLLPALGSLPITEIEPPRLLAEIRKVEARGARHMPRRVKGVADLIFQYAIATGRASNNIAKDLTGALVPEDKQHYPAITEPGEVGKLMRAIDGFDGTAVVRAALRLLPLLFCRQGELRSLEWSMVDFQLRRIEFISSKKQKSHIIPLSHQAVVILEEIHALTGQGKYVFPKAHGSTGHMSDGALRTALQRIGYGSDVIVPHGFRAMARTMLEEQLGYAEKLTEHQLTHTVKDPLGRAYNRTRHIEARTEMMQRWANYLDELRDLTGQNNVAIQSKGASI